MKKIIPLLIIGLAVLIVSLSTPVYSRTIDAVHVTTSPNAAGLSIASSTPVLTYGFAFDLENGATKNLGLNVVSSSSSFTFNPDGTKLYVSEHTTDKVFQYSLTTPFDVTDIASVSLDGSSFTFANEETVSRDIAFSADGLKFYVIGIDGVDFINQYALNVAFDLTQGATHDGAYQSPTGPESMAFSADGFTMFVLSSADMNQYALTSAFDITGGVSYSGTFNAASEGSGVRSIVFDPTGTKLFIYNRNEDEVNQFSLSTPFVITSGVTFDNVTYDIADVQDLSEIEFSADGTKMFHLRSSGDLLIQYDLNVGGFSETVANTGEVEGSLTIQIDGETFTNSGGSLEHKTEYSISNLPLGLDPSLAIAADGLSATLTISGSANDHQEMNDIGSLSFTFTDAAFTGGDASSVTNAVGANSEIGVGFEDNLAGLSYGYYFDLGNGITPLANPLDISDQVTNALSMVFSADGTKLFILDDTDDAINQYTLSAPYDIASTVTFNGSYIPTTIITPKSIAFRDDGLKLFVVRPDRIYQYALNTAFDLTQGVTEEGDLFIGSTNGTQGMIFNDDGKIMFLAQTSGDNIQQFHLGIAYDIRQGGSFGVSLDVSSQGGVPTSMSFNASGTKIFVLDAVEDEVFQYSLTTPYSFQDGGSYDGVSVDISGQETLPSAIAFDSDGDRMFLVGRINDEISQYDINLEEFEENVSNIGQVDGSLKVSLYGDTFVNAGGMLSNSTHYDIPNLPAGLVPSLAVSGDGLTATLAFSGTATNHQADDDVANLQFVFEDAAFNLLGADVIENSTSGTNQAVHFEDNPSLTYGNTFDVANATFTGIPFSVANEESSPTDVAFSQDGTKMFVIGFGSSGVKQYTLNTPFDVNAQVTFDGSYIDLSTHEEFPQGLTFNNDGTKLYIVGALDDNIDQYNLTTPFDISSGVTHDGSHFIRNEEGASKGVKFNQDGTKVYIIGSSEAELVQYSLSTPFDVTSGVTLDGSTFSMSNQETQPAGFSFNSDGTKVFTLGPVGDDINQYKLNIAFDITAGVVFEGIVKSISGQEFNPSGLTFSTNGAKMYVIGTSGTEINQYDIDGNGFAEEVANGGSVSGSLSVQITDDAFTSPSGTLTHGVDYSINNLPSGLAPIFTVAGDGLSAILTLGGNADNHEALNNVSSLQFTFMNSAFTTDNASAVLNAVNAESEFGINFNDAPIISYGKITSQSIATFDGSHNVQAEETTPAGSAFSADGLKMFIIGDAEDAVFQYTLTRPFDIRSGVTYDGSPFSFADQSLGGASITFSNDGTKMFISAIREIIEYSLSTPFDVVNGAVALVTEFNISSTGFEIEFNPRGIDFSSDGLKMFVVGANSQLVTQFNLTDAFSLSSGVSVASPTFSVANETSFPTGIVFSSDGSKMYVTDLTSTSIPEYSLTTPFDITSGVTYVTDRFTLTNTTSRDIYFNSDMSRMFVLGSNPDALNQYGLAGFIESISDDGSVSGSLTFTIEGDTFSNAGGAFSNDDYEITNLPTGLVPNIAIAADGLSAILSLSGNAVSHFDGDDITNLQFTFENSAFSNVSAADITNADSNIGIEFFGAPSAPTDLVLSSNLIAENEASLTVVGTLSTTDVDAGETFTYTLISGDGDADNTSFTIDGDELQTAEVFDFETKDSYSVRIKTNDGNGGNFEKSLTINVTDVSEVPTDVNLDNTSIAENEASLTAVGILSTTDVDAGETFTYTLISGDGDTDNTSFTIDGDELQTAEVFDFETKDSYSVRINTNDGNGGNFEKSLTITVTDVSETPTGVELDNTTIAENEASSTVVGTLSTTDEDAGETFTYTLISGDGDADNTSFTVDGEELQTAEVFDFETKDSYSIRINTNDGNGGDFEKSLTITVTDVSETPTGVELDNTTIAENEASSTAVGTLSTTDEDTGETYTYTLVSGDGDTDNISFTIDGDDLQSAEVFDFETKDSYSVRINTDDGNGGQFSKAFTITITDVFEFPTDLSLDNSSIQENNAIGALIGNLSTTDQDAGETYAYSLVSGDGDTDNLAFTIVGAELQAAVVYDFETQNSYSIRIQTDDGNGGIYAEAVAISIVNAFESPSDIVLSSTDINESIPIGSTVGTFSTTDQDTGETYTYSLVSGLGDTDNPSFSISNDELQSAEVFDFETKTSYTIRIQTNDGNGGTFEETFVISINNQPPGLTGLGITSAAIDENSTIGTAVGDLFALGDEISGVEFTFTFVIGSGDDNNDQFTITDGQLRTSNVFNFETQDQYSIRVKADDGDASSIEQQLFINVNDVSEAPTDLTISSTTVVENGATGRVVGTLGTIDQDGGETYTYSKVTGTGSGNNTLFSILGNSLRINIGGNFESKSSYSIRLQTDDGNGGTFEKAFTITVIDINEKPIIGNQSFDVSEDAINGFVIGNISASDPENDPLTFDPLTGDVADIFEVSSAGVLTLKDNSSIDFEEIGSVAFEMSVSVGDNGTPVLSNTATIEVTVLDVNEAPSDISLSANSIVESAEAGTAIGTFSTQDEDDSDTHTYALVPVVSDDKDNASFEIVGNELRNVDIFDFEDRNSFEINVQTTDNGGLTTEKLFTINISDVPPMVTALDLNNSSIDENQTSGSLVGTLSTSGVELSGNFTYTLVSGEGDDNNDVFSINGDQLVSNAVFDFETTSQYTVRVKTDDGAGGTDESNFAISINDINDTPTDVQLSNSSIDESLDVGAIVGVLNTTDADDGQSHTYQLVSGSGDTDNASFAISDSELVSAEVFDFETKSSYAIRIQTNDANGGVFETSFTITINDLPASITAFELSNSSVEENAPTNTEIGSFSTSGEDLSGNYIYTLITGLGDNDNDAFNIQGSNLQSSEGFDFETQSDYSIRVMTDDGIGNVQEGIFSIQIIDVSEAPTGLELSANSVAENSPISTAIGTFSTTDLDADETYTYTMVSGDGDTDNMVFNIDGDALTTGQLFDFENQSLYSIRVQTDDGNGGTFQATFEIEITDQAEAPTDLVLSNSSIEENNTLGQSIGTLSTVDSDNDETYTYTLVAGIGDDDNDTFTISVDELQANEVFDFETQSSYTIRLQTDDGNEGVFEKSLTINITDVFEKADQTISFESIEEKTFGDDAFLLVASASSELDIVFTVVSGPIEINGSTVTIQGAGTAEIAANQAGDAAFSPAPEVTRTFIISKADQIIDITAIADKSTSDVPFSVEASVDSGLDLSYAVSGPATIEGTTITLSGDEGTVTVTVSQAGNDNYNMAEETTSFDVTTEPKSDQTITFEAISDMVFGDESFALEASASSNLDVTLTIISGPITLNGNIVTITGAGNAEISASQSGNESFNAAATVTRTFEIQKADQAITIEAISDKLISDGSFDVDATVDSGLDLTYAVSGPATIDGNTITLSGDEGSVTVTVSQAGNDNYNMAEASETFDVTSEPKSDQTITFDMISDKVFGENSFAVEASASSGLDVTFTVVSGPITLNGNQVTITGAGTAEISASQSGDESFNAAATVTRIFEIEKADQTITIETISDKLTNDDSFDIEATVDSGLDLTYAVSGPATTEGNTITLTGDEGLVTVTVSQAGNDNYNMAEATEVFDVTAAPKSDQTITFEAISDKVFGEGSFALEASASSGLEVTLMVVNGPITMSGNLVTITGVGTAEISASQPGDEFFNAASTVTRTFEILKADQTITIEEISDKLTTDGSFDVMATVDTGFDLTYAVSGPATIEGNTITLSGDEGGVTVTVSQAGNDNYNLAEATETFDVTAEPKSDQTITFDAISDKVFGDASFALEASASSGLEVSFTVISGPITLDGNIVTLTGAGTAEVAANQGGDESFSAAPAVTRTFEILKADQTISFEVLSDKVFGDVPFTLEASASSNLEVTFTVISGPISLSGNEVTIMGAGTAEVSASQPGDESFDAATTVTRTFEILKADQLIDIQAIDDKLINDAPFDITATVDSGLELVYVVNGPATVDGNTITLSGDEGLVTVTVSQAGNDDYNMAEATESFDVTAEPKSDQTISFESLADKVFGDAPFALVASASSNLDITFAVVSGPINLSGNEVTITGAGMAEISASQPGDASFNAATTVTRTFEIFKADQQITFIEVSNKLTTDGPFDIEVNVDSGLDLDYSIAGPASLDGLTVTLSGEEGIVVITASQAGNENYNTAEVSESFDVTTPGKSDQTITFEALADKTFGDNTFELSATASSGLDVIFSVSSGPITINGSTVTITGAGVATVAANQSGNDNYNSAPEVTRSFVVAKGAQTITFDALDDKTFGDDPFIVSPSSSSGLSIELSIVSGPASLSGDELTLTGAGEVVVAANQPGNANYTAATEVTQAFNVAKADQQLILEPIDDKLITDGPFMVVATIDTELELTYEVDGPASINGTEITLTGTIGTVTVMVSQSGNENYNGTSMQTTFEVTEDVTTGIEDLDWKLETYPNPTRDRFKLIVPQDAIGAQWSLINGLGIRVHFREVDELESWIDLSNVPVGMYYLVVTKDGAQQTLRVIKD